MPGKRGCTGRGTTDLASVSAEVLFPRALPFPERLGGEDFLSRSSVGCSLVLADRPFGFAEDSFAFTEDSFGPLSAGFAGTLFLSTIPVPLLSDPMPHPMVDRWTEAWPYFTCDESGK
jgi:hypothetical protein